MNGGPDVLAFSDGGPSWRELRAYVNSGAPGASYSLLAVHSVNILYTSIQLVDVRDSALPLAACHPCLCTWRLACPCA